MVVGILNFFRFQLVSNVERCSKYVDEMRLFFSSMN